MIVQVIQRNSGQRGISYFYDTGLSITVDAEAEDLINAIQSRFGIVITNAEAEEIRTPAQLIDLITTKVTLVDSPRCLSQLAFHLIRRAAIDNFRLPRLSITPGAEPDRIVPNKHRYIQWKNFGVNLGATNWPELKRSRCVFSTLTLLVFVSFAGAYAIQPVPGVIGFSVAVLVSIVSAFLLAWITQRLKRVFPTSCVDIRDLAGWIVAENPSLVRHPAGHWTRERIAAAVRRLIIEWSDDRDFDENAPFYPSLCASRMIS